MGIRVSLIEDLKETVLFARIVPGKGQCTKGGEVLGGNNNSGKGMVNSSFIGRSKLI